MQTQWPLTNYLEKENLFLNMLNQEINYHQLTSNSMEVNMMDSLSPIWTSSHHHSIPFLHFLPTTIECPTRLSSSAAAAEIQDTYLGIAKKNVLGLKVKCHRKQDNGHPQKQFWLGLSGGWSSQRLCHHQAQSPEHCWSANADLHLSICCLSLHSAQKPGKWQSASFDTGSHAWIQVSTTPLSILVENGLYTTRIEEQWRMTAEIQWRGEGDLD